MIEGAEYILSRYRRIASVIENNTGQYRIVWWLDDDKERMGAWAYTTPEDAEADGRDLQDRLDFVAGWRIERREQS